MSFVTKPWHSHHVLFSREHAASSVLEPCALSSACLVSCWSLVFRSHHSGLEFRFRVGVRTLALHVLSHCVSVRSRVRSAACSSVHMCFVVLHAVRVFIGCVHSCYVLCCVARSWCIHWLRAYMLSCLVWKRGLWVFSLAACSCLVLHMAGDLFAGHVLVSLFYVSTWLSVCHVLSCQLSWPHPFFTWLLVNLPHLSSLITSSFAPFIISLCLQSCASSSSFHPGCILACLVLSSLVLPSLCLVPFFTPMGSFCCCFCFILLIKAH